METSEKKIFTRQMYTRDSEVGKMKLQSVKENLYEATTKVVLYSIEMYTKKSITEWVRSDLILKLDKANKDLNRSRDELEQGHIGMMDITNGCSVINDFVRNDSLVSARNELQAKINIQKSKLETIEEKEQLLSQRKNVVESSDSDALEEDYDEKIDDFFDEDGDGDYSFDDNDEEYDESEDDLEDEEEDDEDEAVPPTELEIFAARIEAIRELEEITNIEDELAEEKKKIENLIKEMTSLTRSGKDILNKQSESERDALENLRTLRNTVFAHKNEDEQEISLIGTWEPEAGPLYQWASEILNYIKTIEARYRYYAWFDDFYSSKEGKDKFDGCKVYVQKQIKELYVNKSSVVFEFAGDLYDKEDDEYNFKKLIENMAISWDTGIRYLTVVTNEDLPELNVFFKECLSGTNKYVDYYLIDRNALRESYRKRDSKDGDYIYFKLLYHLNPSMEIIYWKDRAYTKREFARQVIYKFIKVKNMFQFDARLKDYEKYIDGIDIRKWSEHHLLSEVYFAGNDDNVGYALAKDMEDAIIDFCQHGENRGRTPLFRKVIKASVYLYFYMGGDYVFSYTRSNGQTIHWKNMETVRKYMENERNFKSYSDLLGFIEDLYKSDYFKIWRKEIKKMEKEGMM